MPASGARATASPGPCLKWAPLAPPHGLHCLALKMESCYLRRRESHSRSDGLVCPGLLLWVLWSLAHAGLQRNFHSHHSRNGLPSAGPASAATPPSSAGATREGFAFDQARMPRTALCIHTQGQALHHMYIVSLRPCTPYHRTCDCKRLTALGHKQHSRPWEAPAWATRCSAVRDDAGISQRDSTRQSAGSRAHRRKAGCRPRSAGWFAALLLWPRFKTRELLHHFTSGVQGICTECQQAAFKTSMDLSFTKTQTHAACLGAILAWHA